MIVESLIYLLANGLLWEKMIKNNTFDFFYGADDMIDSQKLLDVLVKAFDYDLSGEIAHMERKNGDIIKMIID